MQIYQSQKNAILTAVPNVSHLSEILLFSLIRDHTVVPHNNQADLDYSYNTLKNKILLTPWCIVLLEQLTGLQLVKKFPAFQEPEGSLPHSQPSATCLYPGPAQSSPSTHIPPPADPS